MSEILKPVKGAFVTTAATASVVSLLQPAEIDLDTTHVRLTIEGGAIRFTLDGTNPTETRGELLGDGTISMLSVEEAKVMKAISSDGTTADLHTHQFIEIG